MLTPEERAARARHRLLEKAKEFSTGTYISRFVAPVFQKMIRAEAGADLGDYAPAIVDGTFGYMLRKLGQCVCVTCGKIQRWDSGIKGMHTGHFLASRCNSILFEETNCSPQCSGCNYYRGGAPQQFRLWMLMVRGQAEIDRLERLKATSRSFSREELVNMRIAYTARLKAAEERMKGSTT